LHVRHIPLKKLKLKKHYSIEGDGLRAIRRPFFLGTPGTRGFGFKRLPTRFGHKLGTAMVVRLRPYQTQDFDFARRLYVETMRWAVERVFGWDESGQYKSFAEWFKPEEVSVITADGLDAGWIQQRQDDNGIFLGSIYIGPAMQRKGIGSGVIQDLLQLGRQKSKPVTLAVMKINPARALYERLGFRVTHEDEYKVYMRADPAGD
jgi:GNAT superfamily N-acetyltransferase